MKKIGWFLFDIFVLCFWLAVAMGFVALLAAAKGGLIALFT